MLIITDLAAIDAAFAAKTPRPFKDVVADIYGDVTVDRLGRLHAPYDGYECPITGASYRAGEFIPMDEDAFDDEVKMSSRGIRRLPEGRTLDGKLHSWDGTRAQNMAVWAELIAQSKAHDAARSEHIGEVGGKLHARVTLEFVKAYEGFYGLKFIHIMKDLSGNVIVYKGGKKLAEKGMKLELQAKVKAHEVRDGVAQTKVERPKVVVIDVRTQPVVEDETPRARLVRNLETLVADDRMTADEAEKMLADWDNLIGQKETTE